MKRYIRQVFHEERDRIEAGKDYVIIARMPVATMGYEEVKKVYCMF
ncbi:Ribonuclease P protein component [Anoxybacillus sp. BCO1]|nr:Ribonuclease P protein component [Anoxybacillus sp. BCO1]